MLLSRFWYLILSAAATAGLLAAMLAANLVNEGHAATTEDNLRRDRFEVEAILKLDARARIDAIAPIAADPDVRGGLRQASARRAGEAISDEVRARVEGRLTALNQQLAGFRGDLVFAVDADGWIVASVAPGHVPPGAGLGRFPLVARALEGYVRDDVWVYNDGIYRMAARPVIEGGQYVGALIHGKRFDDELAQLLSSRLDGATVGFFHGTQMVAGYMPADVSSAPRRDELGQALAQVLTDERFVSGERTEPQELSTGGLAVYSLVTGTAREANVGYAIARPLPSALGPLDLVTHASGESWMQVVQVYWVWGVLAGLLLIAMLFVWIERDRPLGKLRRAMGGLTGSPEARLTVTDFGGQYRKIAQHANDALDHVAQAGAPTGKRKAAANLDEILGPAEAAPSSSFFGFQGEQGGGADLPEVPAAKAPPANPPPSLGAPSLGGPPAPALGAPALDPPRPPPPAAKPPPPKPPAPPPGKRPAEAAPAPEAAKPAAPSETSGVSKGPPTSQRKQLKRTLLGVPPPREDDDDDEDGATMVARVPEELLAQSASIPTGGGGDDDDAHFREVFQSFLDTKKQCGEPTAGLTFEKFVVTLRKNRDQIVSRHGARKVRFTVYVKNGKAALKATPIRE